MLSSQNQPNLPGFQREDEIKVIATERITRTVRALYYLIQRVRRDGPVPKSPQGFTLAHLTSLRRTLYFSVGARTARRVIQELDDRGGDNFEPTPSSLETRN